MTLMDRKAVEAVTDVAIASGVRIFNGALFGATESDHVAVLLDAMDPPPGALVIDAGCGIGETARLMKQMRPDLEILLVNLSEAQLAHCPVEMDRLHADFDAMPLPDACADVVMFSYALCHSEDWTRTLTEARRVLKDEGVLFINDMARHAGDNEAFEQALGGRVHAPEQVQAWARDAGFALERQDAPQPVVDRLKELIGDPETAARLLHGVMPTIWRFRALDPIAAAFARHERIGFQFSGGRDSTATLYLLRPYWDRMTVYHLDSGDQFPETRAVVERVAKDVPIQIIHGHVDRVREEHGLASDLVPADNTPLGRRVSGRTVKIIGRYECCARTIMGPMHERMLADGITLLVRGQRDQDYVTPPLRSGQRAEGFEVLYPIQAWTGEQVEEYLRSNGLPVADFYLEGVTRASDCMTCTAWWDDGRAQYLHRFHPQQHVIFLKRIEVVRAEFLRQAKMLNRELGAP